MQQQSNLVSVLSRCSPLSTRVRCGVSQEGTGDFGQEQRTRSLAVAWREGYRFTVKLRGSCAGILTPSCSCTLYSDTNCPSGRTNPDLFYGNKKNQIKMFPLSEQSTQICPRGPAAPAALSLVYVPVRHRGSRRHQRQTADSNPKEGAAISQLCTGSTDKQFWGSVINVGVEPSSWSSTKC